MKRLSFLVVSLWAHLLWAVEPQIRTQISERRGQISAGYESTELTTPEGTISGAGLRMAYNHWFSSSYAVEFGASVAMNGQGSVQTNSFTGFNLFGYYNLLGQPFESVKKTYLSDVLVTTEQQPSGYSLSLGAGVSQYFLNGNRGVYSASGLGAGLIYQVRVWKSTVRAAARWNQLQASGLSIDGISYDVGLTFPL